MAIDSDAKTVDADMYELVEKILYGVSFIAIGGTLALIFFFVFAPSILGTRAIHKQLESIQQQAKRAHELLRQIVQRLGSEEEEPE
ncbi:MAG: hypothetical protein ACYS76_12480 [Planctomycetota bacterium]